MSVSRHDKQYSIKLSGYMHKLYFLIVYTPTKTKFCENTSPVREEISPQIPINPKDFILSEVGAALISRFTIKKMCILEYNISEFLLFHLL